MNAGRQVGAGWLLCAGLLLAPAWAGSVPKTTPDPLAASAQALAASQQQVVQLSNQLQGLQDQAEQSRQRLAEQDRQIAQLKAKLAHATSAPAASGP